MKLSLDQLAALKRLSYCTGLQCSDDIVLISCGLVESGKSRFGTWVRLTQRGHDYLNATQPNSPPAAAAGPAQAGLSLRAASARLCGIDASQAQGTKPAIQPPAGVLHVEVLPMPVATETAVQTAAAPTRNTVALGSISALMRDLTMRLIHDDLA